MGQEEEILAGQQTSGPVNNWRAILSIILKAAGLFILFNILFAALTPLDSLGRLSLYNTIWPGRQRLPYGEVPAEDYNLTLNNLPGMMASHVVSRAKAPDEFRVLILGDSATWGWFLGHDDSLAGQLNRMARQTADGRRVVAYNLGYPVMSLTKDLLVLDTAMGYEPDLILWPMTMQSLARSRQLDHPLLQENAAQVRHLITDYELQLDTNDPRFVDRTFAQETIIVRRRDLADLLRLQTLGAAWAATGIDQAIPDEIPLRATDLEADESWQGIEAPRPLTTADLTFDVLSAGHSRAGTVPVVVINEPMYISDGANSDIRYNAFYPRWAYDQYRQLLADAAAAGGWAYLDLWDVVPPAEFTDTPVHLTPAGMGLFAAAVAEGLPFAVAATE